MAVDTSRFDLLPGGPGAPDRCALGILELGSIARGVVVADAAV